MLNLVIGVVIGAAFSKFWLQAWDKACELAVSLWDKSVTAVEEKLDANKEPTDKP